MSKTASKEWQVICPITDVFPATGVCALVNGEQVAIFRPRNNEQVFAIANHDPFAKSNVLSRGLICEHQGELWVASPLKKQHFNLATGLCLEDERFSVKSYSVRVSKGNVEIKTAI
ncbi:nitrite reductase small subunit [Vibrio sp. 10N.286.49.B3]|uniref:nitrite reductase small subunit NirD n=1 Tax=Vibrio sp. 10N.286.49.B3 TaxID=1880855 RepID=UPI000C82BF9A|nr:nitrite reductase small subunit NirD [Vibrio sp. 10N.286.49.B3]PMH41374.1 nitrite reductase small subunit [Vibrio sp. 10N.286.49.B3]